MKSSITVQVEFLAGTDIESAVLEANMKAKEWSVAYITFSFNGTEFSIGPSDKAIVKATRQWNDGETRFIVAS